MVFFEIFYKVIKNKYKKERFCSENLSLCTKIVLLYYKKLVSNRENEAYGSTVCIVLNINTSSNCFCTFLHNSRAYSRCIGNRFWQLTIVFNKECASAVVG